MGIPGDRFLTEKEWWESCPGDGGGNREQSLTTSILRFLSTISRAILNWLTFFLTGDSDVVLSVENAKGETVWSRPLRGRKGFNQVRWDLVVEERRAPFD